MSARCYLCKMDGESQPKDAYYVCENCGGCVCYEVHGWRHDRSQNCWCELCFPKVVRDAIDALDSVMAGNPKEPRVLEKFRSALRSELSRRNTTLGAVTDSLKGFLEVMDRVDEQIHRERSGRNGP